MKMNKHAGISYLRIIATIGIVCLHTFSTIAENTELFSTTDAQRHFFNAGHLIWRWAVPAFFMITGALLLNPAKRIDYKDCIKKYCRRIILALVVFSIPFAALIKISEGIRGIKLITGSILAMFTGDSFAHLWYLYALVGIYLVLPVIKTFANNAMEAEIRTALIVLFVFALIVPTLNRVLTWHISFIIPFGYSVFYVLLGYYLMYCIDCNVRLLPCAGIGLLTSLLIFFSYKDIIPSEWTHYDNPLVAVEASMVFIIFKGMTVESNNKRLWALDRLCFAVYLIHPLFIHFCYRFLKVTPLDMGKGYALATVLFCLVFTGCSFAGSFILNRIKLLRENIL